MPWMVIGDLNDIMYSFEKEGGYPRPAHFMAAFRDALEDCNLSDFGYFGDKFTWHQGQIWERIDRAVSNDAWNTMFPAARVEHMEYHKSDHRPLLLNLEEEAAHEHSGPAVLRFEARWLKESNFRQVVEEAWLGLGLEAQTEGLAGKLAKVHQALHHWDKTVFRNLQKNLKESSGNSKLLAGMCCHQKM